jgi:hypothetical protein
MKPESFVSRRPKLLFLFILLFVTLACTCNASTFAISTPTTAPPAPSESPYTPEEQANAGTHTYTQVQEVFACTATYPSTRDLTFSITFSPGAVEVIPVETPSGGHIYNRVDLNTYALDYGDGCYVTVTFYQEGFSAYSEVTEDGGQTYSPCMLYTRTRLD